VKDDILHRALGVPAWMLLLGTVVISEVFTLLMNSVNSLIWWGRIDRDLLLIGTVDALVVSAIAGGVLVFLFHHLRVREALIQAEKAKTESIVLALGDGLCFLDRDFRILYQNTAHIRDFGVLYGRKCYEAIHGLSAVCEGCPAQRAFLSEKPERMERALIKDGKVRYIENTSSPVLDRSGHITGVIEIIRDITDKQELRHKEETLKRAQAVAHMGSWQWDIATNELQWSREVFNIYGLDPETCTPDYSIVTDAMHPDSREEFQAAIEATLKGEAPFEMDYSLVRPDGEVRTVHTKGEVLFDEAGQPLQMLGTVYDITERKKYEAEMQKLAVITEQSAEGIAVADMKGYITFSNQAWAAMHGYEPQELIGKHLRMFHNEEQLAREVVPFNDIVFSKGHHSGEVGHMRRDGSTFPTHMTSTLLKDEHGKPFGIVGSATDITERKLLDEQLRQSIKDKDMLIKEINHRVKNNLAVITSLLRLQSRSLDDKKAKELFIESENRVRAMSMIHERLSHAADLRYIEFGEYLRSLVNQLFHAHRSTGAQIRLVTEIEDFPLDVVQAVPCALIANELVTNSLKHAFPDARSGEIHVAMSRQGESGYLLRVKDNGIGIPEDFDLESTKTMGLTIAHSLAGQLGAELKLNRTNGTEFSISFSGKAMA